MSVMRRHSLTSGGVNSVIADKRCELFVKQTIAKEGRAPNVNGQMPSFHDVHLNE
jgi:hypothetical protein